jgi:hypothetical protein
MHSGISFSDPQFLGAMMRVVSMHCYAKHIRCVLLNIDLGKKAKL